MSLVKELEYIKHINKVFLHKERSTLTLKCADRNIYLDCYCDDCGYYRGISHMTNVKCIKNSILLQVIQAHTYDEEDDTLFTHKIITTKGTCIIELEQCRCYHDEQQEMNKSQELYEGKAVVIQGKELKKDF